MVLNDSMVVNLTFHHYYIVFSLKERAVPMTIYKALKIGGKVGGSYLQAENLAR